MNRYGTTPGRPDEYRVAHEKAVRPKDASTLIIVKPGREHRILLGKRSMEHKFMPGKFVFPGGKLDYIDQRLKVHRKLQDAVMIRLRKQVQKRVSDAKLTGLALAAIRETFEETGLVIGHPSAMKVRTKHEGWAAYLKRGVIPPLDQMDFIARAVTPPYRSRRFDTRFFMIYDDLIQGDSGDLTDTSGELLDLHWLTLGEARDTDLPAITRVVIDLVEERTRAPREKQMFQPSPYVRFSKSKHISTML
ncbi:NUDIX hydrolase [Luminiphilus sp.]|nr:NUDIX hydrolase [Luminiphilus sp.]